VSTVTNIVIMHNFEVTSDKSNVARICSGGNYVWKLIYSFCKFLFVYRIEQPNILSADRLFRALETCPLIARVCVISLNSGRLSAESTLVEFVSGAPKLVFLYVLLGTLTQAACSRIEKSISERYVSGNYAEIRPLHNIVIHFFFSKESCLLCHLALQYTSHVICYLPHIVFL